MDEIALARWQAASIARARTEAAPVQAALLQGELPLWGFTKYDLRGTNLGIMAAVPAAGTKKAPGMPGRVGELCGRGRTVRVILKAFGIRHPPYLPLFCSVLPMLFLYPLSADLYFF